MSSSGSSGSFRRFLIVMLLVGPVMTVAVAWGCRWMAQRDHEGIDRSPMWSEFDRGFWSPAFETVTWHSFCPSGGDGREYVPQVDAELETPSWPTWSLVEPFRWNDCGVEWIMVGRPMGVQQWTPSTDPDDWIPTTDCAIPAWSSVQQDPLIETVGLIELAAGWPRKALWTQHRRVAGGGWTPFGTETTGSLYGYLPFSDLPLPILYQPIWSGFAIDSLFWSTVLAGVIVLPGFLWRLRRSVMRRQRRRCPHCGYSAGASGGSDCSECGWPCGKLDCTRWSRASVIGGDIGVVLLATELILVAGVLAVPELSVLERAAYRGDLQVMREEFERPDWGMARWPDERTKALHAAMAGGHDDAVALFVEERAGGPPKTSGQVTSQYIDVLLSSFLGGDRTVGLIEKHRLLDPRRSSPEEYRRLVEYLFRWINDGQELARTVLQAELLKNESKQILWPLAMSHASFRGSLEIAELLLEAGVARGEGDDVGPCGWRIDVAGFVVARDPVVEALPLEQRVAIARRVIEATRVENPEEPGSWQSVLGAASMLRALRGNEPGRRAAVELLLEYGLSEPVCAADVDQLWTTYKWLVLGGTDDRWVWSVLIQYGADPAICDHDPGTGWTLWPWVADREASELVRFLLEHGAVLTLEIYDHSVPPVRAVLDAWMTEQGMTLDELPAMVEQEKTP